MRRVREAPDVGTPTACITHAPARRPAPERSGPQPRPPPRPQPDRRRAGRRGSHRGRAHVLPRCRPRRAAGRVRHRRYAGRRRSRLDPRPRAPGAGERAPQPRPDPAPARGARLTPATNPARRGGRRYATLTFREGPEPPGRAARRPGPRGIHDLHRLLVRRGAAACARGARTRRARDVRVRCSRVGMRCARAGGPPGGRAPLPTDRRRRRDRGLALTSTISRRRWCAPATTAATASTPTVENAIRPFCLGRRSWLFADTVAGARASARLYSLVQCAKANGLEPYRSATADPAHPGRPDLSPAPRSLLLARQSRRSPGAYPSSYAPAMRNEVQALGSKLR